MTKQKLFFLLATITLLTGLCWQSGDAQSQLLLTSVEVNLLPEIDRPSIFVIYDIYLEKNTSLPIEMTFQFPADADIISLSNILEDEGIIALDSEETTTNNLKKIRFTTTTHTIRIEYYDPNLVGQGNHRTFNYQWLSDYPVESLSIVVQPPIGASEIESEPALEKILSGEAGIEYYLTNAGSVPAGETYSLVLMYTETTTSAAYPVSVIEPATPINETTLGRTPSPLSVVLWLLTVAVAVSILVGLYYWWFQGKISDKRDRIVQGVGITNPEKQVVFCHECGKRSRMGDKYCSNCGTELRKPTLFDRSAQI